MLRNNSIGDFSKIFKNFLKSEKVQISHLSDNLSVKGQFSQKWFLNFLK